MAEESTLEQKRRLEVASLILQKTEEGRIHWKVADDGSEVYAVIGQELIASIKAVGNVLAQAQWDRFQVEEGDLSLIDWAGPYSTSAMFGTSKVPGEFNSAISRIYIRARDEAIARKYESALSKLSQL